MSMLDRIKILFDVPSRRRGEDYSKEVSPACKYGVFLLYRDLLDTHDHGYEYWLQEVQRAMAHTHFALSNVSAHDVGIEAISRYVLKKETPDSAFLDFLELSLRHDWALRFDNDFVDAANTILAEHDSPYQLTRYVRRESVERDANGDQLHRTVLDAYPRAYLKQNTVVQQRAIEPALEIFSDPAYKAPAEDFRTSLDRHRQGDYDGCITACAAAVEGAIKIAAKKNGWRKVKGDGLGKLAKSFISRSSLPDSLHTNFSPLAVYRSRSGDAHGHDAKDEPTESIARYFVANAASLVVLVHSETK